MTRTHQLAPDISSVLSYLELLIVSRKLSIRDFERRMKMSHGTMNRLFSGKLTLKLQTLLDMLQVLGIPARSFFAAVFSEAKETSEDAENLLRRVQKLSFPEPTPTAVPVSRVEIKQLIVEVLRDLQNPRLAPVAEAAPTSSPARSRRSATPSQRTPRKETT